MKTENFDKPFRHKLLDLTPGKSVGEAKALYQRIAADRKRTQRKRGAFLLFVLLFISLFAVNIGQWLSIRSLEEKNEQLTGHIRNISISLKQLEQQHGRLATTQFPGKAGDHIRSNDADKIKGNAEKNNRTSISQNVFVTNGLQQNTATGKAGYYAGGKNMKKENNDYNSPVNKNTISSQQTALALERNLDRQMQDSSVASPTAGIAENCKDSTAKATPKKIIPSLAANDSLAADEYLDLSADQGEHRFKLNGRAGFSMQKANTQAGGGITGDIFIGRHWGLNIGLNYLGIDNDDYSDEEDFRRKKGHNFRDYSLPNLSDTVKATNIDIDYSLLQIPLAISYRLGLRKGFFIQASIGTDLDVYGRKKIAYFTHAGPYNEAHNSQSSTSKVIVLNNAVVGLAAEKQWKRFTLQAGPFLSPQLKKTDYKSNAMYYGFRLRCFYNFGT